MNDGNSQAMRASRNTRTGSSRKLVGEAGRRMPSRRSESASGCPRRLPFFLYYLYAVVRSANEVPELRYRTDKNGQVIFHDEVDIISPIAVPGKTFYTVRIPYHEDFKRFYAEAYELITNIPEDGNPYGAEEELAKQGDYDVVHLSAVPKMYFTATTYTLAEAGNGCSYPLMTSGKAVTREGRLVFPLSIYVNHAFVDGSHLASFFQKIEEHLKRISRE